jgi:glyoxylase-like metal-dependent hydrolase (beta-lactamase superfamily II)
VNTEAGTVVLASDVVPLYQNLREMIPLGFGMNFVEMLESFEKVKSIMGPNDRLLVPGHDVEVFERFPKVGERVVQIA